MRSRRLVGGLAALATAIGGSAVVAMATPATAGSTSGPAFEKKPSAIVAQKGNDGRTHVLESKGGAIARPKGSSAKPDEAAKAHLSRYADAFGVKSKDLKHESTAKVADGSVAKFDQTVGGVSVLGGQLAVSLDKQGNLESINGETSAQTSGTFPSTKGFAKGELAGIAKQAAALQAGRKSTADLLVKPQGPQWYDPTLVGAAGDEGLTPVLSYEVLTPDRTLRYAVLVNAATKKVELAYSLNQEALNRVVCDAERAEVEDITDYACDGEAVPFARTEGGPASSVDDVNKVYDYFYDTAVRYASYTNVDVTSLIGADYGDGEGQAIRATVRVCTATSCPYENAFWDGQQMVFGEGVTEDDITAHELTHGVTQHTSGLQYIYQSGAINEGLSDFLGEIVDITNGSTDDTAENRWLIGEGSSIGAIRDMADPAAFDQPDKMTSNLWFDDVDFDDNGGVHFNSGVFNKAGYLMVDGGDFNGYQINGLGLAKSFKIGWTLENLLTTGADYKDVFHTLPISCRKNIGREGSHITEDDCQQVDKIVRATEMYKDPLQGSAKNVDYCDSGTPTRSYYEGFDAKGTGWTYEGNWLLSSETGEDFGTYASVGEDAAVAWVFTGDDDTLTQDEPVEIPEGSFLRFDHSYLLAPDDGAAVEYSVDGGTTWQPASELPNVNGEDATADTLGGADSFAETSNGYGGTRYDLSELAGQSVQFRFHAAAATDASAWWVDNFKIYTCS